MLLKKNQWRWESPEVAGLYFLRFLPISVSHFLFSI